MDLDLDNGRLVFSWVRVGLLHVALWQRGNLGTDVLLLRGSRLVDGEELAQLKKLLARGQPEPDPPRAA